jgi:hypothetical protein
MNVRHAQFVGWVLGLAHRNGVPLRAEIVDGHLTNRLALDLPDAPDVALWVRSTA